MSLMTRGAAILAAAAATTLGTPADAQSIGGSIASSGNGGPDIFARDRGVTVRDRPRPEYEASGVDVGGFVVYPRLQVDAEYNDNVLAAETDEQSSAILRVRPELTLSSNWNRNSLTAFARASVSKYESLSSEDTTDWTVGGSGSLEVARDSTIAAGVNTGRQTEARTSTNSPVLIAAPIRYDVTQAYVAGVSVRNRLKFSGRADWRRFDFDDGLTTTNVVIGQDDRDRDVASVTGRVDYAISPATAVFVQATGNERDYRITPLPALDRNSSGYELLAGASFELGALVRGEIAAGYIEQSFDNPLLDTLSGFGARGEIVWLPTQLTTVTVNGSRTVEDSGVIGSAGYLSSVSSVQIDHELLRNVILTGTLIFTKDDFESLDRTDDRWTGSLSATYLFNRYLGVSLSAAQISQDSSGLDRGLSYDVRRLSLSLVSQF